MRSIRHCLFGGMHAAASTILVVAIAKFSSYDKNRGEKTACTTHHINIIYLFVILARKVSILGLSTEWGDIIFQSIIVRGKNENL